MCIYIMLPGQPGDIWGVTNLIFHIGTSDECYITSRPTHVYLSSPLQLIQVDFGLGQISLMHHT